MDDWRAWTVMDRILHIDYRQTDRLTDGRTLVLVKLLSRLKILFSFLRVEIIVILLSNTVQILRF